MLVMATLSYILSSFSYVQGSATSSELLGEPLYTRKAKGGLKEPLFDQTGKLRYLEIFGPERQDLPAPSSQLAPVQESALQDNPPVKPSNVLSSLNHLVRKMIFEALWDCPKAQFNLMLVSHGFRRFVFPMEGREDITSQTGNALIKHLLIVCLGVRSLDVGTFMQDYGAAFQNTSIEKLRFYWKKQFFQNFFYNSSNKQHKYKAANASLIDFQGILTFKDFRGLVPLNFQDIHVIKKLFLSNNRLVVLPPLTHLTNLEELDLSKNHFEIPPDLTGLTKLTNLNMSQNSLTEAPKVQHMPLYYLDLSDNKIGMAPNLYGRVQLRHLDLSNNDLGGPPDLGGLKELRVVKLQNNSFFKTPEIYGLNNLEYMHIDVCALKGNDLLYTFRGLRKSQKEQNKSQASLYTYWNGLDGTRTSKCVDCDNVGNY